MKQLKEIIPYEGLILKLLIPMGIIIFISVFVWSGVAIHIQKKALIEQAISDADKFCNTALNFTWFAMFHNPDKDMLKTLRNISSYNKIEVLRIFDSSGKVKCSSDGSDIGTVTDFKDKACIICHFGDKPVMKTDIKDRTRIFKSDQGELRLGIINPILNEPDCSTAECHYHPPHIKKIGSLDVVVSLEHIEAKIAFIRQLSTWTAIYLFTVLCLTIWFCVSRLAIEPIKELIRHTDKIGKGDYDHTLDTIKQKDEIGQLSLAINDMGQKIKTKQYELNQQKDRYLNLFDQVPCYITVQNKDYRIIEFNKEFSTKFGANYGAHCYYAYKGINSKCINCPVEKTFNDGLPHYSEESGINKDGTISHWFVKTAPLKDAEGNIVAVLEMSIDTSGKKILEEIVEESEKRYEAIFKGIPNPVFMLDSDNLQISDCNDRALTVYGYEKEELESQEFSIFFQNAEGFEDFKAGIDQPFHEKLINLKKSKELLYVNIWLSPAIFNQQKVLLVTVIDISQSVETEQQLIQAGKMATLGEMATGVAHELNQPLSVIKTASSFISRKLEKKEAIDQEILNTLSTEIEAHVDRAAKITSHMRLFGRKPTFSKQALNVNNIIKQAFDIFRQQLRLREIDIRWELDEKLPMIMADPVRLEQVFINLLINARDSIVTQTEKQKDAAKQIIITSFFDEKRITVQIADTGTGVPDTMIDKLFEPFFTTKKEGEGTGLGLSISYGIILESGGDISVKNNPSPPGGATFTIQFYQNQKEDK
jgi:histidine kinase